SGGVPQREPPPPYTIYSPPSISSTYSALSYASSSSGEFRFALGYVVGFSRLAHLAWIRLSVMMINRQDEGFLLRRVPFDVDDFSERRSRSAFTIANVAIVHTPRGASSDFGTSWASGAEMRLEALSGTACAARSQPSDDAETSDFGRARYSSAARHEAARHEAARHEAASLRVRWEAKTNPKVKVIVQATKPLFARSGRCLRVAGPRSGFVVVRQRLPKDLLEMANGLSFIVDSSENSSAV
ncbi:hypothetical protein BIW11_04039, partial [Tropilaelaps mercedesae]